MSGRRVAVVGAGVAGMAAALLLARRGWAVTLLDRDGLDPGRPEDAPTRPRTGIPHFIQPHAFIPRGQLELQRLLPDVHADLLDAGAAPVDLRPKLPGAPLPEDEALQYLAVRRPLIEWALLRAVAGEPGITRRPGVTARRVAVEDGRVVGLECDAGAVAADLVVDAHGRRRSRGGGLGNGAAGPEPERTPCHVVYYSRYYRCRPGFAPPDGPWFLSPRGDLGYAAFASFPGDNGTFAAVLSVPSADPTWRQLADPRAFEAAVATIPSLSSWADPAGVDPITDVLPMAGLYNVLTPDPAAVPGLIAVGDAYCHTDPTLAHGLAFALVHAAALAEAADTHTDPADAGAAYRARTAAEVTERFALASELDEQRARMWRGDPVDPFHCDGDYALFTFAAAAAVARVDPTVFRVFIRRIGLLDRTGVLDEDRALQRLIEERFAALRSTPAPPPGPPRDEMLAVLAQALER